MSSPAKCSHCGEPLVIVLEMDDRPILDRLDRIEQQLGGIRKEMRNDMSEIDDKLDAEDAALTALEADEQRELADLTALKAEQPLSDAQAARFDALTARVAAADAAILAADPAPVSDTPAAE